MVTLNACAAPDPAKPAAKTDAPPTAVKPAAVAAVSAPLPAANAAPLRLAPGQALPTSLTELTIIDREIGDSGSAHPTVEWRTVISVSRTPFDPRGALRK